jgi:hypothetical protein
VTTRHTAAIVLSLAVCAASDAGAQPTLQYRWKQGDVLTYQTSLKTISTVSGIPGMADVTREQSMTQRVTLRAAAVTADGTVTLHQTIDAVRVEMGTPTGRVMFDSADPDSKGKDEATEAMGRVFGGMVGSTISVVMASNGAIQRVDGVQKALDKIVQDLPQDRAAAQMTQSLKSVLSEPAIRASLEQSFPRLPSQAVKPGDTWTGQVSLGSDAAGRISGEQTFTVKTLGGPDAPGVATIDVALVLKQESAPPLGPSGMIVKLGESKGRGEITFDVARGRILKSTMQTDMPSTMTSTAPDGRPVTMKNSTRTSMTMELVGK